MPFALHTFLAPRKPEYFPPLPGLPTSGAALSGPLFFDDLGLEDDIVFDEVFLDIMGLNDPVPSPMAKFISEPGNVPRSDSIVAPLLVAGGRNDSIVAPLLATRIRRKASLANFFAHPTASFDSLSKSMDKIRQPRSKSISGPSAYYRQGRGADILKPLPLLPDTPTIAETPILGGPVSSASVPTSSSPPGPGFGNNSLRRKMSTPSFNRFFNINFSGTNNIPIPPSPTSPTSPGALRGPSSV
ncbi:hypothetical protein DRE_02222 [Drechslerella stenobrocha 248]|uniref:Uncharacterized protein n=1 Tax=Drechslerella stenobrocha 248 TaxID=1043628 RepID=W7I853_9PEZI|nr:hypothetical protein DRE_02222 [Drechslerella stenobrocha 248]